MNHSNITLYFQCGNVECDNFKTYEWNPDILVSSGTPICECCGEDLEYVGWEEK